jgi:hypothetical protein
MTCEIIRWGDVEDRPADKMPGELKLMRFHCDAEGCEVSPSDEEIIAAGGLTRMGWECYGGKHYCPEHRMTPMTGVQAIEGERRRQVAIEGWTPEHDSAYRNGELTRAAACYALGARPPGMWPWADSWWKPGTKERNLEKAGALIAAELDRLTAGGSVG